MDVTPYPFGGAPEPEQEIYTPEASLENIQEDYSDLNIGARKVKIDDVKQSALAAKGLDPNKVKEADEIASFYNVDPRGVANNLSAYKDKYVPRALSFPSDESQELSRLLATGPLDYAALEPDLEKLSKFELFIHGRSEERQRQAMNQAVVEYYVYGLDDRLPEIEYYEKHLLPKMNKQPKGWWDQAFLGAGQFIAQQESGLLKGSAIGSLASGLALSPAIGVGQAAAAGVFATGMLAGIFLDSFQQESAGILWDMRNARSFAGKPFSRAQMTASAVAGGLINAGVETASEVLFLKMFPGGDLLGFKKVLKETLGTEKIVSRAVTKAATRVGKDASVAYIAEVATEGLQRTIADLVSEAPKFYGSEIFETKEFSDYATGAVEEMKGAATTFFLPFVTGAGVSVTRKIRRAIKNTHTEYFDQVLLHSTVEQVRQLEGPKVNPQRIEKAINSLVPPDKGTVYIDTESIDAALAEDPEKKQKLFQALNITQDDFDKAADRGEDLQVSTGTVAAKVWANPEFKGLEEHMKFSQEHATTHQLVLRQQKDLEQEFKDLGWEEALAESRNEEDKVWFQDMTKQLLTAYGGKINEGEAKQAMASVARQSFIANSMHPDIYPTTMSWAKKHYAKIRAGITEQSNDWSLAQFASRTAKTANTDALMSAIHMAHAKKSNAEIRDKTGWFMSEEGEWMWEISDKDAEWEFTSPQTYNDRYLSGKGTTLGKILKHDKLFAAYPQLKDVKVRDANLSTSVAGEADFSANEIRVTTGYDDRALPSTILHEIQHFIQHYEGLTSGTSAKSFSKYSAEVKLIGPAGEIDGLSFIARNKLIEMFFKLNSDGTTGISDYYQKEDIETVKKQLQSLLKVAGHKADIETTKRITSDLAILDTLDYGTIEITNTPFQNYWKNLGERMARDTEKRRGLSDEERAILPPDIMAMDIIEGLYTSTADMDTVPFSQAPKQDTSALEERIKQIAALAECL